MSIEDTKLKLAANYKAEQIYSPPENYAKRAAPTDHFDEAFIKGFNAAEEIYLKEIKQLEMELGMRLK